MKIEYEYFKDKNGQLRKKPKYIDIVFIQEM